MSKETWGFGVSTWPTTVPGCMSPRVKDMGPFSG